MSEHLLRARERKGESEMAGLNFFSLTGLVEGYMYCTLLKIMDPPAIIGVNEVNVNANGQIRQRYSIWCVDYESSLNLCGEQDYD